jgi:hypothetical protein
MPEWIPSNQQPAVSHAQFLHEHVSTFICTTEHQISTEGLTER